MIRALPGSRLRSSHIDIPRRVARP